jgi:hypothetical protein
MYLHIERYSKYCMSLRNMTAFYKNVVYKKLKTTFVKTEDLLIGKTGGI